LTLSFEPCRVQWRNKMSTYYLPNTPIPFEQVRKLALPNATVKETKRTTEDNVCLTDGRNCLWARRSKKGFTTFARYGDNDESQIIEELQSHFGVWMISEHDKEWKQTMERDYREDYITIEIIPDRR